MPEESSASTAGVGACHCLNGGELMGPVHSAAPPATGAARHLRKAGHPTPGAAAHGGAAAGGAAATLGWLPIRCWLPWSRRSEQGPPLSGDCWLRLKEWIKTSDLERERYLKPCRPRLPLLPSFLRRNRMLWRRSCLRKWNRKSAGAHSLPSRRICWSGWPMRPFRISRPAGFSPSTSCSELGYDRPVSAALSPGALGGDGREPHPQRSAAGMWSSPDFVDRS